jgi:hypothetical protein
MGLLGRDVEHRRKKLTPFNIFDVSGFDYTRDAVNDMLLHFWQPDIQNQLIPGPCSWVPA